MIVSPDPFDSTARREPGGFGPTPDAEIRARRLILGAVLAVVCAAVGFNLVFLPASFLFGGLAGIAAVVVILARPYLGLVLYAAVFVLRPGELYPALSVLRLERLVGAVTLAAMLLEMIRREGKVSLDGTTQSRWLFLFLITIYLTIPSSFWPGRTLERVVDFLKIAAFYVMIVQLVTTRRRLLGFVGTYIVLIVYLAFTSLRAYLGGELMIAQGIDRAVGTTSAGGNPNSLGATLGTVVPLGLLLAAAARRFRTKLVLGAGIGLCLWTMLLTGSRSSVLGLVAAALVLWLMSGRKALYALLGSIVFVGTFYLLPGSYRERYSTITSTELDESSELRVETWRSGVRMLLDRPLLGVGAGAFGTAHATAYSSGNWLESHSLYIQVPAEIGLIGTGVFFGFLIAVFRLNRRARSALAKERPSWRTEAAVLDGVFAGLCFLLVFSIFGHTMMRPTWYVLAAVGLAVYRLHHDLPPEAPAPPPSGQGTP